MSLVICPRAVPGQVFDPNGSALCVAVVVSTGLEPNTATEADPHSSPDAAGIQAGSAAQSGSSQSIRPSPSSSTPLVQFSTAPPPPPTKATSI